MFFPQTVLFPVTSPQGLQKHIDQPRISREDPTVFCSHSLLPLTQPGTVVVPSTPGRELNFERPHPVLGSPFVSHLRLRKATWRGKAQASVRGWAQSSRARGLSLPWPCEPPPPPRHQLPTRLSQFAPALPGKSLAGREGEETARQRGLPLRAVNQGFVCANLEP